MRYTDNINRINEIEKSLSILPKGNITTKQIRGRKQLYLQWTEDGKQKSKYIKIKEEEAVKAAVEKRRELEEELEKLKYGLILMESGTYGITQADYETRIITGANLGKMCEAVEGYEKRECISILEQYLSSSGHGKVCVIYGLRRTGKTTLVLQAISKLPKDKVAYIKIMSSNTMSELNRDLQKLSDQGYEYIFIDEVTLMKDFIDSASLLSDVYAMFGMKIVLSGTDSLGFALSMDDELYDRAIMIHTTFISFAEYARLLDIHSIDEYIRYGGTFKLGEVNYDDKELMQEDVSFRDDETTRRYIDTAIARKIQHSLACYNAGGHFRHLVNLYEAGELTSAVNKIIEDMNHRFLISVVTAVLEQKVNALDIIDEKEVTERLRYLLDIKNKSELSVTITDDHITEIKEYLYMLDLICDCPIETIGSDTPVEHIIFSQPGMRYCQAQSLVYSLMKDEIFMTLDVYQRDDICNRILEEVRGRLAEDIILLETTKKLPKGKKAFKLQFAVGEIDMVIYNVNAKECELYEIKHSSEIVPEQYRHLIDAEKNAMIEKQYGRIVARRVLYRGRACKVEGIEYVNIEDYLECL